MSCVRSCENCRNRCRMIWGEWDNCLTYEMAETDAEMRKAAKGCGMYEEGNPFDDGYTSATRGDYGPSNPWNAPGMSIHDFI